MPHYTEQELALREAARRTSSGGKRHDFKTILEQAPRSGNHLRSDLPVVATLRDHFTLPLPSSTVRYRHGGAARVIEGGEDFQYVLEEHVDSKEHDITVRRIQDGGTGLRFVRATYTIVTIFWAGFLFAFMVQLLLLLALHLAITLGITDRGSRFEWFGAFGAIFGVYPLVFGLASGMVLVGAFVSDTWRGHLLVRNFTLHRVSTIVAEWLFFSFFLGLPLTVMGFSMLVKADDWWVTTGIFWIFSIATFFVLFAGNVVFYEMKACLSVMNNFHEGEEHGFFEVAKRSILLRQTATYSGEIYRSFLSRGTIEDAEHTDKSMDNIIRESMQESKSLRARINHVFVKMGWFNEYDEPKQFFTLDDARDVRPYVTTHTWSLEKYFCRPRNSRYVAIIKGPGAVTRAQMKSSVICTFVGSFLVYLLILGSLVYVGAGWPGTFFLLLIAVLLSIPNFMSSFALYRVARDVMFARTRSKTQNEGDGFMTERDLAEYSFSERASNDFTLQQSESEGLYLLKEWYRTTYPKPQAAWVLFGIEVVLLLVWPTLSLLVVGNWPLALWYFVIVTVSGLRYYLNPALVMESAGYIPSSGRTERELWQNQSRLNEIVGGISRGKSRRAWMTVISILAFIFLALFSASVGDQSNPSQIEDPTYTYLNDYEYLPIENSLRYPTCYLTSDLQESPLTSMADYIFLARVAYRGNVTQQELDNWFGKDVAVDQSELVSGYREENDVDSAVVFKLITYPTKTGKDFAYMAIRGTTNTWEALTDAQLWAGAVLMQGLREMLPFGSIWIPIMPYLISAAASAESSAIEEISFYKDTVQFTNFLKNGDYAGVAVTGHSLGGGLSMITGAEAHVPSVALSGPNNVLTRRSLDPKVSRADLDRYTFNIIPDRDVVPMIDLPSQNFQNIRCNAEFTDIVGCHDTTRALCEAIFTCGSDERPIPCECVTIYNYPPPRPRDSNNGIAFVDACKAELSTSKSRENSTRVDGDIFS